MDEMMVSIICLTYNHSDYIVKALDSFLMQETTFDYEVIVGEDCSTDNTLAIVEAYAEAYPDIIRVVTSEENVGSRANGSRARAVARGKYTAICEGDDYWTDPHKLQLQVTYMEENPRCSMTFHAARFVDGEGELLGREQRPYTQNQRVTTEAVIMGGGGFIPSASTVYRTACLERMPDFYEKAIVGDYPKQMILAAQGNVYYFDRFMSDYRYMHQGSWTINHRKPEKVLRSSQGIVELLDGFDAYSDRRYHETVDWVKAQHEFRIHYIQANWRALTSARYKEAWAKVTLTKRLRIFFRSKTPRMYQSLKNLLKKDRQEIHE